MEMGERYDKFAHRGPPFGKASRRFGFGFLNIRGLVDRNPRLCTKRESGNYFLSQFP
jgi:hypothetical protein